MSDLFLDLVQVKYKRLLPGDLAFYYGDNWSTYNQSLNRLQNQILNPNSTKQPAIIISSIHSKIVFYITPTTLAWDAIMYVSKP